MTRQLQTYHGAAVTVTFDPTRCIHNAHCIRHLPAVFDAAARPWVRPDAADAETVRRIVAGCPTGALKAQPHGDVDSPHTEAPDASVAIRLAHDGPLFVRGAVAVVDGDDGALVADDRLALCRCGLSKRKPYCDNSHHAQARGWSDPAPTK